MSVDNGQVAVATRGFLKIKRIYTDLGEDISKIRTKGSTAINNEEDRTVFLGMCEVLDRRFETFMERFEDAVEYCESHSLEPPFPTVTDTLYRASVKTWYYEALGYKEILQRKYSQSLEHSMAALSINEPPNTSQQSSTMPQKLFLPKIRIKPFSGDLSEWPAFKQLFCALIKNERSLSNAERFHFLTSYLEGPAYDTIKHIPIIDTNFEQAWEALKLVYDDERKLACSYLEKFLSFKPIIGKPTADTLQRYLANVTESITSLKNLNIPHFADYLLCELALRSLDPATREDFEISIVGTTYPTFTALRLFIQNRCQVLRITSGSTSTRTAPILSVTSPRSPNSYTPRGANRGHVLLTQSDSSTMERSSSSTPLPAASSLSCFICKGAHIIRACERFIGATPHQRLDMLKQYPGCKNCFHPRHRTKECQSRYRCRHCNGLHNTILHLPSSNASLAVFNDQNPQQTVSINQHSDQSTSADNMTGSAGSAAFTGSNTSSETHGVLLGTVVAYIRDACGTLKRFRGILDIGSQFSFVTEQCARDLGKSIQPFHRSITGVNDSNLQQILGKVSVTFFSASPDVSLDTDAVVVPSITPPLPQVALTSLIWQNYLGYDLSDPDFMVPGDISFLIGADLYPMVINGAPIVVHHSGPRLISTVFGYAVVGRYRERHPNQSERSVALLSRDTTSFLIERFWETEEPVVECVVSPEDEQCETHFVTTHRRTKDGRYIVALPFKQQQPNIMPYTAKALSRLYSLESKFVKSPRLREDYIAFMSEYQSLGHMSVATCEPNYLIPHHPVYKVDAAGNKKLRVVFDASFRGPTGSLNDYLLTGPKLQADIGEIVLKFRQFQYVLTCDIVKMFRQILVKPDDQPFQQIAWRKDPGEAVTFYQLKTVTYGLRSSPFLAQRVLRQLVHDEGASYPEAAFAILNHTYVDDIATGCNNRGDLVGLRDQLIALLERGGFQLSRWNTNCPQVFQESVTAFESVPLGSEESFARLLGMEWNPVLDTLSYKIDQPQRGFTKRVILSNIARLFDPLGYLTPVIFFAKTIMQETWKVGVKWDDEVPNPIKSMWETFINELTNLSCIQIPRMLPDTDTSYHLICFSDASEKGYCAAIYLRSTHQSSVTLTLLKAKSRLAPLKSLTVPRLELCGAVLMSQLISSLNSFTKLLNISQTYCFTDSTIVLAWLRTAPHLLQTFVANRVQQVLQVTNFEWWHHIRGTDNPADVGSRGILPSSLERHPLWWSGPAWCCLPVIEWPLSSELPELDLPELKKAPLLSLATLSGEHVGFIKFTERFSSYPRLIRVLAYIDRFIFNCKFSRLQRHQRIGGLAVSSMEFGNARAHCFRLVQRSYYPEPFRNLEFNELPQDLRRLAVFLDHAGVLRVGGRLSKAPLPVDHKHPVLLPARSHLTTIIVRHFHEANHHIGPSAMLSIIRQQFWLPRARALIKQQKLKCITCLRFSRATGVPFMGDLPASRFNSVRPFMNTGVDFAGPFLCKSSIRRNAPINKVYLCLFVCLSTRAVHLELATALSAEAFLDAFDRFAARRGLPAQMFSDCGTNFIGASGYIRDILGWFNKEETQSNIVHHTAHLSVRWNFNPPSSPHFGGSWESAVKSAKTLLFKVFGNQSYRQDELSTMFTKVEGLLNSRPLLPLTDSPDDVEVLTPGHFLVGQPLTALPEPDFAEIPFSHLNRWQILRERVQHFWNRWRSEYLSTLQVRQKWYNQCPNLRIGDVVVVWDARTSPSGWPLGRVTSLHPGADGVVRVVTVRTSGGVFRRPSIKLIRLPVDDVSAA